MITGVLGFFGAYWCGYLDKNEITGRCLVAVCAAIIGTFLTFAGEFLFRLLRAPAKMAKEAEEKLEAQKVDRRKGLENKGENER